MRGEGVQPPFQNSGGGGFATPPPHHFSDPETHCIIKLGERWLLYTISSSTLSYNHVEVYMTFAIVMLVSYLVSILVDMNSLVALIQCLI